VKELQMEGARDADSKGNSSQPEESKGNSIQPEESKGNSSQPELVKREATEAKEPVVRHIGLCNVKDLVGRLRAFLYAEISYGK
jgi:hypothetical protein